MNFSSIREQNSGAHLRVTASEIIVIAALSTVLFLVNLATSTLYPVVWVDEIMFTDPAVNLFLGNGFTTTAWPYLASSSFFAGYPPLYSVVLSLWLNVTEISPVGVRSFNYVLIIVAALVVWGGMVRSEIAVQPWQRILLVALVLFGYGISASYRSGRPDTLMMVLVGSIWLSYTLRNASWRYGIMLFLGCLLPMAGMQLLPYTVIMLSLVYIYIGRTCRVECIMIGGGVIAGTIMLLSMYWLNGVWSEFLLSIRGDTSTGLLGAMLGRGEFHHENKLPKDLSLFVLLAAGLLIGFVQWRKDILRWRSPLSFGIAGAILIPVGMAAAGKFPTYYSWMAYLPLSVGVISSLASIMDSNRVRRVTVTMLIGACLVGLPFQLTFVTYDRDDRRYDPIEQMVESHVSINDRVFCDYGVYYAVKNKAARLYGPHYLKTLSSEERGNINAMIVDPALAAKVQTEIGGEWYSVGEEIKPERGILTEELFGIKKKFGMFDRKYRLQVYRRLPTPIIER